MEINSLNNLATTLASTTPNDEVGLAVLKKANEVQASTAAALLEALPPATKPNLPAHLGQNVNTTA
ncbi:putative motility protein [Oxalobacteraceae bacterium OM1]|nr:putative motility protein [Oxalobacteraceae bacterium OM1]